MKVEASDPGFGIYIHWPFCAQKCPYCDFNSHVRFGGVDEPRFLTALKQELNWAAGVTGPRREVSSIFIGGGTPSLMNPATVDGLIDHVARLWPVADGVEITLEANPGSVEAGRFAGYRAAGVNRVSLGVQSLRDAELKRLGRIHSVAEAKAAVAIAQRTFDRFSFDLIYARPGQSSAEWRLELSEALAMAGDHLSLYQLTIEDGTPFAALHRAGKLVTLEPELAEELYALTQELTEAHGVPAYEISNHAQPGSESRHNLLYWRYGSYVGVGPGAHGRLLRKADGERLATTTRRPPEKWLSAVERDGHGMEDIAALSASEQADEMLLMGLRITEGIDLSHLARAALVAPAKGVVDEMIAAGLLLWHGETRLAATRRGRLVLDRLVADLAASLAPVASLPLSHSRVPA